MRMFFALWPDAAVRAALASWGEALHTRCGGRPVPALGIHMTLAFLGEVPVAAVPALEGAAASVPPRRFTLALDCVERWPRNRIVWAGARAAPHALAALVAELRARLAAAAFHFDPQPFVPHVTLLRDTHAAALPACAPISWPVAGFALVRSERPDGRSAYAVQQEWRAL